MFNVKREIMCSSGFKFDSQWDEECNLLKHIDTIDDWSTKSWKLLCKTNHKHKPPIVVWFRQMLHVQTLESNHFIQPFYSFCVQNYRQEIMTFHPNVQKNVLPCNLIFPYNLCIYLQTVINECRSGMYRVNCCIKLSINFAVTCTVNWFKLTHNLKQNFSLVLCC